MNYQRIIKYLCIFIFLNSFFFVVGSYLAKIFIEKSALNLPPQEISAAIENSYKIEELREISSILFSHITDSINYYTELTNKISNYVLIFSVINLLSIAVVIYFLIKEKKTT